ncbi:MAG: hypothetical protein JWQ81_1284 [Amycolatopsis sp.]|uniref:Sec-independent protein translocase TatB n=1 Tax=Amycolatopsis sp. TaxID=37632 RepID=UPI002611AF64|nr:Sec-independent protein translocase TatB [Amycolatopsis sp.]MCU1680545.1 hypothetical protein [Amycolatopsis sp.]
MFGLSLEHITILVIAGLFILGPERLPGAAAWVGTTLRKVRDQVATARDQINTELGPEFEELRKPLQDLQALRGLDPRTTISRFLTDDTPQPPAASPAVGPQVTQASALREPGSTPTVDMDAT